MDAQLAATAFAGGVAFAYLLSKAAWKATRRPKGQVIVYYHSECKGFTGRADAIVRMLEHAGVDYVCKGPQEVPESFAKEKGCFAVPFVEFPDGLVLSQSQAIHQHLGTLLGLNPSCPAAAARCMQAALNVADVTSEGAKKLKGDQARLTKWMSVFEGTLATAGSGFMGNSLTYADFACHPWLKLALSVCEDPGAFPKVQGFVKRMDELPSNQKFDAKGVPLLPASMMP